MIAKDELIEYARYVKNYYGTPKEYVRKQLDAGKDVILEIEIQGALKVKEEFPDTLLLFVTPPSAGELKKRLVGRGTETMDVIESRMNRACEEAEGMDYYDYLVVNDDLNMCVEEMHMIIQGEHRRSFRNEAFMKTIKRRFGKIERRKLNMLHPSYTDLMKVVNKDVEEGAKIDRQQSLFDRYGNIETCQTTDCRRPSACRCRKGRGNHCRSQSKN